MNVMKTLEYNDSLLSLSGASRYSNILSGMAGVITIILTLVSIACIIVIYNSFAISVMERKKQFGLFSSIGATRKQLAKTVFFEAFIVALIGIPLGILSGIVGIGTVLIIINKLLPKLILISTSFKYISFVYDNSCYIYDYYNFCFSLYSK